VPSHGKHHKREKKDTKTWGTKPNPCYTPTKYTTKQNKNLGADTYYEKNLN